MSLAHLVCAGGLLLMVTRCIWPHHCGEGFAAGFAGGAVVVMGALWAIAWLLGEGLMLLLCSRPPSEDD